MKLSLILSRYLPGAALLPVLALLVCVFQPAARAAVQTTTIFPYSEMAAQRAAGSEEAARQAAPSGAPPPAGPGTEPEGVEPTEEELPPELALPEPEDKSLSRFERYVRQETPPGVAAELFQFGYEMFEQPPSTFAPIDTAPVGPDYVLGPGDGLRIIVWGKVNEEYETVIDRDGKIVLPVVGTVHLAGLTFAKGYELIRNEFHRYFRDIKIDVAMGRLRTMQVYVVGKAKQPGCYTISALSTMVNALFAAGGPSKVGSMRAIQLKRGGATIADLDLYDLLIGGDKTSDARLLPEDVIFIPPIGPLVGIAGNVRVPAIYELKGETTATGLIAMAGGINDIGFRNRLQLLRVEEGKEQQLVEFDLEQVLTRAEADIRVQGGDVLKVYPVAPIVERTVQVTGTVKNPGTYGLTPAMTVRDLITYAGGLLRYAGQEAELSRIHITPEGPRSERIVIALARAMAGDPAHNLHLQGDDYLFVRAVPEWETHETVAILGEVRHPGTYAIAKGERLSQLIERAGGFTDEAYPKGAIFTRVSAKELQQKRLKESIDRLEQEFMIGSATTVEGALSPSEAAMSKSAAERRQDFIARMRAVEAQGRIAMKLKEPEELRGTIYDIMLEEGDQLFVPQRPDYIQVMGAVYNPEAFVYNPEATVSSYLRKAGGATHDADQGAVYILKADGTVISKRQEGWLGIRWDEDNSHWLTGFYSLKPDPGDTVVVPVKLEKIFWLREIKDLTQIIYQIAVTAGVLLLAF